VQKATDPTWVKRSTCRACGSPQVRPSKAAYVYCEYCGELMDWDFQAAIADKRSKLPGPAYEAILRSAQAELAPAKARGDKAAYELAQMRIWEGYASACPAALSPRIGDEHYKKRFVAWTAKAQTACDFDPTTAASMDLQNERTRGLLWDRSNPFAPRAEPNSFHALLAAVMAHQKNCVALYAREGMLDTHPDRPTAELFTKMGVSAMCQGWMPFLEPTDVEQMLATTGLKDEFGRVDPPSLRKGNCPSCGSGLEAVEGAKKLLCYHCGHMAVVGGGTMKCHGCGSPVDVPTDANAFRCGACDAELKRMVWL
jgi:predicted RNA-binding Zn-ribbon protein involved in translation (DUF1610 family)